MTGLVFVVLLGILFLLFVTLLVLKSVTNLNKNVKFQKYAKILLIIDGSLLCLVTIIFIIYSCIATPVPINQGGK